MKKYKIGKKIKNLKTLQRQEFVFIRGKVYHCGWFMNMQARLLQMYIERDYVFKAKKIKNL